MIMSPEIGNYQGASFLFSHIPPSSGTGTHTHASDEIMYVIGRGESRVGDEVSKLETDSVYLALVDRACQ